MMSMPSTRHSYSLSSTRSHSSLRVKKGRALWYARIISGVVGNSIGFSGSTCVHIATDCLHNKTIVHGRFRPGASSQEVLSVFIVEQNSVGISAVTLVVFYRRLGIHMTHHTAIRRIHKVIHKTGSTQHIALPSEEDRACIVGNICKIFGEYGPCIVVPFYQTHYKVP